MLRFLAAAALWLASGAWAANLLDNPGFEAGTAGWTISGASHGVDVADTPIPGSDFDSTVAVRSGSMAAWGVVRGFCCADPVSVTFAQTVAVAPGQTYELGFYLNNHSRTSVGYGTGDSANRLQIFANGVGLLPTSVNCPGGCLDPVYGWTHFSGLVNVGAASSLTVEYRIIASGTGYVGLSVDDFYVTGAVPEPGTMGLMAVALAALGLRLRSRRSEA